MRCQWFSLFFVVGVLVLLLPSEGFCSTAALKRREYSTAQTAMKTPSNNTNGCGGALVHKASWDYTSCPGLNYTLTIAKESFQPNKRKVTVVFEEATFICQDENTGQPCTHDREPDPHGVHLTVTGKDVNFTLIEGMNKTGAYFYADNKYAVNVFFPDAQDGTQVFWSGGVIFRYPSKTPVWVVILFITLGVVLLSLFIALGVCAWESRRPLEHGYETIPG